MGTDQRPPRRAVMVAALAAGAGLLLLAVTTVADEPPPPGQRLTFPVVADTFVAADRPEAAQGTSRVLVSAPQGAGRTLLRFAVRGLHGAVTDATLKVWVTSKLTAGFQVATTGTAWDDATTSLPGAAAAGEVVGSSGTVSGKGWAFVRVSAAVRGNGPVGLALLSPDGVTRFASRESGRPAQLIVRAGRQPRADARARPAGWSASDPVVAAAGDIACDEAPPASEDGGPAGAACQQVATSDLLLRHRLAAVLALGDNQYEDGTLAKYRASYGPSWGRLKAITHPVPGNHDYVRAGGSLRPPGYFRYFGAAAGNPAEGYYSYDLGGWHLIALNSQCGALDGCRASSREERWLRRDLARHGGARCTLAYWHEPRFSSGPHGQEPVYDDLWRDLYAAGVDVVLNGHDHVYERFAPQDPDAQPDPARGIREFVVGTGGRSHYTPARAFRTVQPNSEVRDSQAFGVLELTLHAGGYDWRFVPTPGGAFSDAGTGWCH
jgi:acid phosphatase type 7